MWRWRKHLKLELLKLGKDWAAIFSFLWFISSKALIEEYNVLMHALNGIRLVYESEVSDDGEGPFDSDEDSEESEESTTKEKWKWKLMNVI